MQTRFNERKTTQAAASFLKKAGGSMNYMKLMKLLYLGDRGAFLQWGRPITGDGYFSMKFGPVLSGVHDLITEGPCPGQESSWSNYISAPSNYEVQLKADPGNDELSRAEENLIEELFAAYGHYEPFDLVKLLHETLPEWKEVKSGRIPIDYREILQAGGKTEQEVREIESELLNVLFIETILEVA